MTLATRPIFAVEEMAIAPRLGFNRLLLGLLGSTMAIGFVFPVALAQYLPKPFKTFLLGAGLLASAGVASMTVKTRTDEAIASTIQGARLEQVRADLQQQIAQQAIANDMAGKLKILHLILQQQECFQPYFINEYGLNGLAAPLFFDQPQQQAAMALQAEPITNNAYTLDISEWEAEQVADAGLDAPQLYGKCSKEHMIFVGNQGEGKSTAAQYALWLWATQDRDLVPFWFDPHFGSGRDDNDRYNSLWCGLPQIDKLPSSVQAGVFKGTHKDLLPFLRVVQRLFRYRRTNGVKSPRIVVGIEEATNLIPQLSEAEVEEVTTILAELGTEAPKFGMNYWLICHTLTKEELRINRGVLRQAHIIGGAEWSSDKVQVSNAPRTIAKDSIDYAADTYRALGGKPAGFVTTLPVPNGFLPVPPVKDTRDLLLDWVPVNDQAEASAEAQKEAEPQAKVQGGNIHEAIAKWIKEIGRHPTVEEVQDQVEQLMGQRPNQDVAEYLIREYTRRSRL